MSSAELLPARLEALFRRAFPQASRVEVSGVTPMSGGNARHAWSFDVGWTEGLQAQSLACVLLSQIGGRQLESNVGSEYRVLRALAGSGVRAPAAVAVDEDGDVVGAPSIVLERMPGRSSLSEFLDPSHGPSSRRLIEDLAEVAAELHGADWRRACVDDDDAAKGSQRAASLEIAHWHEVFLANRLEPHPVLVWLYDWLADHVPTPKRLSLVHGDLRPGNFLYLDDRITALLDWEMAHVGDPVEDLAWVYRPLWSPEKFLPLIEFVGLYAKHSGYRVPTEHLVFYRVFSEVKFATISLTAAKAFASGKTTNLRLADRAAMVPGCLLQCLEWLGEAGRSARGV